MIQDQQGLLPKFDNSVFFWSRQLIYHANTLLGLAHFEDKDMVPDWEWQTLKIEDLR